MQVYPLRNNGLRLLGSVIEKRGPVTGYLGYRERMARSGIFVATLLKEAQGSAYALPPLDRARLLHVTDQGLLIAGLEVTQRGDGLKGRTERVRQSWWCVPCSTFDE